MPAKPLPKHDPAPAVDELTRKEELLKTAVGLFSRRGYKGTSIREIARAQGLSVSNMYHYFADKEDLWVASQEYSLRWLPERLETVWDQSSDPVERFKLLLRAHLEVSVRYQNESKIFMMDQEHISSKAHVRHRQAQKSVLEIYVRHIEALQQAGQVSTRHSKILAFNILGVINWYLRWYKADGYLPPEEVFDEIVGFILYGTIGKVGAAAPRTKPP